MADKHSIYKLCLKEIAEKQGTSITFMAKPFQKQSGSGCHIHFNLSRKEGNKLRSAFFGDKDWEGIASSDEFRWFLGGWIKFTPELMPFYAPTINSYKRFVAASWAPVGLAAGRDNRTAGFRIVGDGQSLRIENRIPGADCNPYLALAASLASGLEGIAQKIEPPPLLRGDGYTKSTTVKLGTVPRSLSEAVNLFSAPSSISRKLFGNDIVDHYTHFYRDEITQYNRAVTDWEVKRYFEQI
eukprot:TRINITY_DN128_c0_g1_i1.p1 TRINITY_DN128_c0_g1~~TRINITY_DN128_c0_g1_i1.p1  ORF type:complete len:241 (+),score=56.56 TRINITY_DN128_c0_g1_i1:883-1605(+)